MSGENIAFAWIQKKDLFNLLFTCMLRFLTVSRPEYRNFETLNLLLNPHLIFEIGSNWYRNVGDRSLDL